MTPVPAMSGGNDLDFRGTVVAVTGGSGGIGRATVKAFAERGARVFVLDRMDSCIDRVRFLPVDVTARAEVDRARDAILDEAGRIDVLVTCAGIARDHVLWKLTDEDWDTVLAVNLTGTFNTVRAVVPAMRERKSGAIVLIASINGERGKFGQANYAASKAGVVALGKTAARELGRFGIRVNVVAPGYTTTPMTENLPAEILETARSESALNRLGEPEDIALPILFLASDLARHVTGQVLRVDGGQLI